MFVPTGVIDNMSALVRVMASHRLGNKVFEQIMTNLTDEYLCRSVPMC